MDRRRFEPVDTYRERRKYGPSGTSKYILEEVISSVWIGTNCFVSSNFGHYFDSTNRIDHFCGDMCSDPGHDYTVLPVIKRPCRLESNRPRMNGRDMLTPRAHHERFVQNITHPQTRCEEFTPVLMIACLGRRSMWM
jgi:hypothetical protein